MIVAIGKVANDPVFFQLAQTAASPAQSQTPTSSFIERFKYNVISSSLLELSLPTTNPQRTRRPQRLPGNLHHSRNSSIELDNPPGPSVSLPEYSYGPISISALLAALLISVGYPFLAFLSIAAGSFFLYNVIFTTDTPKYDMSLVSSISRIRVYT